MRFSEHYGLNERIAYSSEYKVPKDREHLLYDFYAMTMFYPTDKVFDPNKHDEEIYYFDNAIKTITDALIKEFKMVLRFALSAELGHLLDSSSQTTASASSEGYERDYSKELDAIQKWHNEKGINRYSYAESHDLPYAERYEFFKKMFPDDYDLQEFADIIPPSWEEG